MASVFISYRRDDSALVCGRINDRLAARFGRSSVFMDVHSIPAGEDFAQYISTVISECSVQLVVIGKRWLTTADQFGRRRLDKSDDLVRIEIETAIRFGLVLIPILIENERMPLAEALPDSLAQLAKLNALPIRDDPDFDNDIERVISALEARIGDLPLAISDWEPGSNHHCRCCKGRHQPSPSKEDKTALSAEREQELDMLFNANVAREQPPYFQVNIRSIGELQWILQRRGWSGRPTNTDHNHPNLAGIDLSGTNLAGVELQGANLSGASLGQTNLTGALLSNATLAGANLGLATLNGADLGQSDLAGANLAGAQLRNVNLERASIRDADLSGVDLNGAVVSDANLQGVVLTRANLSNALLSRANLRGASLFAAILDGADFSECQLAETDLRQAHFDSSSRLIHASLDSNTRLADVMWNGVALATIYWPRYPRVGDEVTISLRTRSPKRHLTRTDRMLAYEEAIRAYRGLSIALRAQGLRELGTAFRLREQVMERRVARMQGKVGAWAFSLLYDVLSGYGERPGRLITSYVALVTLFAAVYYLLPAIDPSAPQVMPIEALVLSITSFHGRGLVPGNVSLSNVVAQISAIEAVIGIFIEVAFLALILRRFLRE